MKFEYLYNVGDKVFCNDSIVTIKRRYGKENEPAYLIEESSRIVFEKSLSPIMEIKKELKEERGISEEGEKLFKQSLKEKDEKEYKQYLYDIDNKYSSLSKYSRNLNLLAIKNELNPTYFREKEVNEIKTILLRRTKPNPILTGVAGCGKTAIIEELARSYVNDYLNNENNENNETFPIIYDLSLNSLLSGSRYRGDFEEKLQNILNIVSTNKKIIIFIDEIHTINDIGTAEGATSAGQILKPALARGDIRCIGATTEEEYNQYIMNDKALARRFSKVEIKILTGDTRKKCIDNIIKEYGNYFKINTNSIDADSIINLIDNIIPNKIFPDNVIDIIDETLATAKFQNKKEITIKDINAIVTRMTGYLII